MITLSYKSMNSHGFNQAISKIFSYSGFHPMQARNVLEINRAYREEMAKLKKLYTDITKEYVALGEDGKPVPSDTPPYFKMKEDTKKEEMDKRLEELFSMSFEIPSARKINQEVLSEKIGLSTNDLLELDEVVAFSVIPVEENNVTPIKK